MSLKMNNQAALRSINLMNIFLLSVHTCLLLFFALIGVHLMVFVNVGSVLFYIINFFIVKHEKITLCIFTTFLEIMIHMFLAVVSTGWDTGFQLYFIGCIAIVFYADYFSVRLGQHHIEGIGFSIISASLYLISLLITRFVGSVYQLVDTLAFVGMVLNSIVVFAFITMFLRMLTKLAAYYEEELGKQATHDKLTGMVNRYYLVDQLDKIYSEQDMSSYWVAILDIDDFKKINDKYGHLCGDFVLKSVAEIIKDNCGDRTVCRWGGEEFVIVGSDSGLDVKGRRPENVILDSIRRDVAIKDFVYDENTTVNMTVTIGAARYREGQTVDEWVNVADERLYRGKKTGKNKVVDAE